MDEPYRPEHRGPAVTARRWFVYMPMVVPGIAAAGLYWGFNGGFPPLPLSATVSAIVFLVVFFLLFVFCCLFVGWVASCDSDPAWRKQHWSDAAMIAGILQLVITPVVAGLLIAFFLPKP
ncbi:hypothetical protein [Haloferula sp. BvORR071]|uniref:hypothetical protein n=1 Tax=Haloferula sp. BvORR071 TaxID=1396141 RepID=UPI002240F539|nr:hypothetical protein [Haloferula sp. BvORR071]